MITTQFRAGYLLECIRKHYPGQSANGMYQGLIDAACTFDVETNLELKKHYQESFDSLYAVLNNLICRGLPTQPSVWIERAFAECIGLTEEAMHYGSIRFESNLVQAEITRLLDCLHLVDPRLELNERNYHINVLGSTFEQAFLFQYLPREYQFLAQLLEPQRPLGSIVEANRTAQFRRQKVDFALEIPYLKSYVEKDQSIQYREGFVIEIDGAHFHGIEQQKLDALRDQKIVQSKWQVKRINSNTTHTDIQRLIDSISPIDYIRRMKKFFEHKTFEEQKLNHLQMVLSPIAIARIQKVMAELFLQGQIVWEKGQPLRIAVIERDVPCGYLAIEDFQKCFNNLLELREKGASALEFETTVFCTPEFKEAGLHLYTSQLKDISDFPNDQDYDLIIDISMWQRSGIIRQAPYWDGPQSNKKIVVIRSSHHLAPETARRFYTGAPIVYRSLANRKPDETYEELDAPKEILTYFLQNLFRKEDFRPGQIPILDRALRYQTVIGLLPTGGGKSLTYQLAALLQPGAVLVVDPIRSLMQDQYEGLLHNAIDACNFINSTLNTKERKWAIEHLSNGEVLFAFISPERLQIEEFRNALVSMKNKGIYFSYCVIDEVHCVSEWGHDFRTSYLELGRNAIRYCHTQTGAPIALFGLTATASFDVLADVERELSSPEKDLDPEAIVRYENTVRPELQYEIVETNFTYTTASLNVDGRAPIPIISGGNPGLNLKGLCGKAKQGQLVDLLVQAGAKLHLYNHPDKIKEILRQAYDNFIPDEFKRKKSKQGYTEKELPRLLIELPINPLFSNDMRHAGIIFCPHRQWLLGVTDRYKKEKPGVPPVLRVGVAEALDVAIAVDRLPNTIVVGTFMGSSDEDVVISKNIDTDSFANLKAFTANRQNVMIATKAFGMGIDKPNIRFTIHLNFPTSIESFVQEAGRAGRDGHLALNMILYNRQRFLRCIMDRNGNFPQPIRNSLTGKIFPEISKANLQEILQETGRGITDPDKYIETFTVDQDVQLFFHSNSFKGIEKEKAMLDELLTEISFPVQSYLRLLSDILSEEFGEKIRVGYWEHPANGLKRLYVNPDFGYIDLNQMNAHPNWATERSREVMDFALANLLSIDQVNPRDPNELIPFLRQASIMQGQGIEEVLDLMDEGEEHDIIVPFTNLLASSMEHHRDFLQGTLSKLLGIEVAPEWIEANLLNEKSKPTSLSEFLDVLQRKVGNTPIENMLNASGMEKMAQAFYRPREKADTDKALYRLASIGIIDNYSVDYHKNEYKISLKKQPIAFYRDTYQKYLERYYSDIRALQEIEKAEQREEASPARRYLFHLVEFVYDQIARKRRLGIFDMDTLCRESIDSNGSHFEKNFHAKEFIHLYFNSKYARTDYKVNDELYSLVEDTQQARVQKWKIVWKYMEVINIDTSASPIDNIKHLRGAALRLLRANPDNAALQLLKAFAIFIIAAQNNNRHLMEEGVESAINGFLGFRDSENLPYEKLDEKIEMFREKTLEVTNNPLVKKLLEEALNAVYLEILARKVAQYKLKLVPNG